MTGLQRPMRRTERTAPSVNNRRIPPGSTFAGADPADRHQAFKFAAAFFKLHSGSLAAFLDEAHLDFRFERRVVLPLRVDAPAQHQPGRRLPREDSAQSHSAPDSPRSYQRPPTCDSSLASNFSSGPMRCLRGHQTSIRRVKVSKTLAALSGVVKPRGGRSASRPAIERASRTRRAGHPTSRAPKAVVARSLVRTPRGLRRPQRQQSARPA